ncbi:hypothetical protein MRB53_003798 [Persea americana]|uniref:Uncharacterized protein n=1 Tax=Persea americana TaxID=3435 RepID=A0ACC2MYP7_PERAE|nr:hypothetical protein MRB53_003798 [Persea americana]
MNGDTFLLNRKTYATFRALQKPTSSTPPNIVRDRETSLLQLPRTHPWQTAEAAAVEEEAVAKAAGEESVEAVATASSFTSHNIHLSYANCIRSFRILLQDLCKCLLPSSSSPAIAFFLLSSCARNCGSKKWKKREGEVGVAKLNVLWDIEEEDEAAHVINICEKKNWKNVFKCLQAAGSRVVLRGQTNKSRHWRYIKNRYAVVNGKIIIPEREETEKLRVKRRKKKQPQTPLQPPRRGLKSIYGLIWTPQELCSSNVGVEDKISVSSPLGTNPSSPHNKLLILSRTVKVRGMLVVALFCLK